MYAVSGLFGLIAVIFTDRVILEARIMKTVILALAAAVVCLVDLMVLLRSVRENEKHVSKNEKESPPPGRDDDKTEI